MYGDMSAVRSDASALRARAKDVCASALQRKAPAEAMNWNSAEWFQAATGPADHRCRDRFRD
jgi:hypothetical protein